MAKGQMDTSLSKPKLEKYKTDSDKAMATMETQLTEAVGMCKNVIASTDGNVGMYDDVLVKLEKALETVKEEKKRNLKMADMLIKYATTMNKNFSKL